MAEEGAAGDRPSEEELRQRVEEQLRRVRVQDLLIESVAGILNLAARRIAKEDERDLEQARIGIDAVRALVGLLEPEPAAAVRDALSDLQMLYAREASRGEEGAPREPAASSPSGSDPQSSEAQVASDRAGSDPAGGRGDPAAGRRRREPPPRLWTPPGST